MYVVIKDPITIVVTKTLSNAEKVLKLKKRYFVPYGLRLDRGNMIYHYELYGMELLVSLPLPSSFVGKIMTLEEFIKIKPKDGRWYKNTYFEDVNLESITPEYIDEIIQKTKNDLEVVRKFKNRPKVYAFYNADWAEGFVRFVKRKGTKITSHVYYYENANGINVVNIHSHLAIFIPYGCTPEDFQSGIEEDIKKLSKTDLDLLKYLVHAMLQVPKLQDYGAVLLVLGVV